MEWFCNKLDGRKLLAKAGLLAVLVMSALAYGQTGVSFAKAGEPYCKKFISAQAIDAVTGRKLYEANLYASKLFLAALAKDHLTIVGGRLTEDHRKIAAEQLSFLNQNGNVSGPYRDLKLPVADNITITIEHPVKWLGQKKHLAAGSAKIACEQYLGNNDCGSSVKPKVLMWRHTAKQLLLDNHICTATTLPENVNQSGRVAEGWYALFGDQNRYGRQLRHLQDLTKTPFRRSKPRFQLLYIDFFSKSLRGGSVSLFLGYFSKANKIEAKFPYMQKRLRVIVSLLLASRILQ